MAGQVSGHAKAKRRRQRSRSDGSVNQKAVLELLERQQYRCALTGRDLTPETASLDHIVPVCRGGEHHIVNTQVLEYSVNRAKGTLTNEEFIVLCGEVWRHTQSRNQLTETRVS
jgi:5-methylcytosine-specific restriction endonuclease McrA